MARKPPRRPSAPPGKGRAKNRRSDKGKAKDRKKQPVKLKGWLKTPADWARFDAWAKINAQPRKIPEPEPIVRQAKPLSQLRKRLPFLMQPPLRCDERVNCKSDMEISLAALCYAKVTQRLDKLSWPVIRMFDYGRAVPFEITQGALTYTPSPRIIELSEPKTYVSEECREFAVSKEAMAHRTTSRERRMALAKKWSKCPDSMTEEERAELFTPTGVKRSALNYKFTAWMELLALPSYKAIKERKDKEAKEWKRKIVEEGEKRGKEALEEQQRKRRKQAEGKEEPKRKVGGRKKERRSKGSSASAKERAAKAEDADGATTAEDTDATADEDAGEAARVEDTDASVAGGDSPEVTAENTEAEGRTDDETEVETEAETEPETEAETEGERDAATEGETETEAETDAEAGEEGEGRRSTRERSKTSRTGSQQRSRSERGGSARSGRSATSEMSEDEDDEEERERKRKEMKNAWRYEPPTCKEDPYAISRAALSATASKRTEDLAAPHTHENKSCKEDPFAVKKSALSASASPAVERLAKPHRPRSPIERAPKRETDEYGRVIYEKPPYGKKLPKVKPYKMGQVVIKEAIKLRKKERPIDPIVYQPTIDPCACPSLAKLQTRERKRAEVILAKQVKDRKREVRKEKKREQMKEKEKMKEKERMREKAKKTKGRGQGDVKKKKATSKGKISDIEGQEESAAEESAESPAEERQDPEEQEKEEQEMEEQEVE